jgi:hypothetical protein
MAGGFRDGKLRRSRRSEMLGGCGGTSDVAGAYAPREPGERSPGSSSNERSSPTGTLDLKLPAPDEPASGGEPEEESEA